jgi:hypothetical protein
LGECLIAFKDDVCLCDDALVGGPTPIPISISIVEDMGGL